MSTGKRVMPGGGRCVRPGSAAGHEISVGDFKDWQFPGQSPGHAVWFSIGGYWTAVSLEDAVTLANALIDTVEHLEANQ